MEYLIDPFKHDENETPEGSTPSKARVAMPPGSAVGCPPIYFPLYGVQLPRDEAEGTD
jgi:hypothetical protein